MSKKLCPICECDMVSEFVLDLEICQFCNHIFKKEMIKYEDCEIHNLEFYTNLVDELRKLNDEGNKNLSFEFDSLILFSPELSPSEFYDHKINHYFNQMSLNILMRRCGYMILEQTNKQIGTLTKTQVKVEDDERDNVVSYIETPSSDEQE